MYWYLDYQPFFHLWDVHLDHFHKPRSHAIYYHFSILIHTHHPNTLDTNWCKCYNSNNIFKGITRIWVVNLILRTQDDKMKIKNEYNQEPKLRSNLWLKLLESWGSRSGGRIKKRTEIGSCNTSSNSKWIPHHVIGPPVFMNNASWLAAPALSYNYTQLNMHLSQSHLPHICFAFANNTALFVYPLLPQTTFLPLLMFVIFLWFGLYALL